MASVAEKDYVIADLSLADYGRDEIAIAEYPNRGAMLAMSMSEAWQTAAIHRSAGLEGQLNIECLIPPDMTGSDWAKRLLQTEDAA